MVIELPVLSAERVVNTMKCLQSKTVSSRKRLASSELGSEMVELALILPMMLMLLVGMFWLGRMFNVYQTITRAAREGARVAVSPSCGACGNSYPGTTDVTTAVNNALSAASLDTTKATVTVTLPPSSPGQVSVQVSYPVTPVIPFTTVNLTKITIATQVSVQQE